MHTKKHKSHKLHSIPISLCRNNNYLVSYSIPLGCMVALLLLGIVIVNPNLSSLLVGKSSAITIHDEWVITDGNPKDTIDSEDEEKLNSLLSDSNANTDVNTIENQDEIDDSFGGFGGDEVELSESDTNAGISLLSANSAIGITISNTEQTINTVQGGGTAYGNYDVRVTGTDVTDYALSINAGSANLTPPTGGATVSGVGTGTVGSSIGSNKWGYVVTDTSTTNYAGLTYKSVPTTATQIASGNATSSHTVDVSKRLVFAASFATDAAPGTYSAKITMSATATPYVVLGVWSNGVNAGVTSMKDIGSGFCGSNIPVGSTITLADSRDNNLYNIIKMQDGTCWMTENLRLKANTPITPDDSDVKSNWTLPKNSSVSSSNMDWGTDYNTAYMAEGSTSMKLYSGSGAWKEAYGNYYSWCAATAMSCLTNRTGAALNNTDAAESICPKNWKLPTNSGAQSFQNLYSQYPNSTTTGWATDQTISYNGSTSTGYNGLKLGYSNVSAFFPAAGRVNTSGGLGNASSNGYYWSRRANSDTSSAYNLRFYSGNVRPQSYYDRYYGFSVRCVAQY